MSKQIWMVRAGNENVLAESTYEKNAVAIGWNLLGDVSGLTTREQFRARYREAYPEDSEKRAQVSADQIYRFVREIQPGDYILTYIKATREILIGTTIGAYQYNRSTFSEEYPHIRQVNWLKRTSRDDFSEATRNSMGSTLTVFNLSAYQTEIEHVLHSTSPAISESKIAEALSPIVETAEDLEARHKELIADRISKLDPYEFQDLVAAVLRAMGYRAYSVAPGPDRGIDVVAYADALGIDGPRIKVQVKHRKGSAGGPDMRNFSATLQTHEKGLFVSSGDFTRDAMIEAEYKSIRLFNRDDFLELMLEHYDKLDSEFKAKIPLRRIWVLAE